eukprot:TRINITY_DN12539_c0_g1_i3.p1 TRINITY_DN12539_c0_g1~~TRINITY_DN12539_c0_g1_i3.p1  ORF type:complete len:846 (-),score=108.88 TRINITY_DN12539_c0_g1_i3:2-2539(-)
MPVSFPKTVKVTNFKLSVMHIFLSLAMALFVVWSFITKKQYTTTIPNNPTASADFVDQFLESVDVEERLCQGETANWFRADESPGALPGDFFLRVSCDDICTLDNMNGFDCRRYGEIAQVNSYKDISIYTGYMDTNLSGMESRLESVFYPWSGSIQLSVSYRYKLAVEVPWFFGLNQRVADRGSNENSHTLVLDRDGRPFKHFAPAEVVMLSVAELVYIATGDRLKSKSNPVHEALRPFEDEELPDSPSRLPEWVYVQGVTVEVRVNCFSDNYDIPSATFSGGFLPKGLIASGATPVCLLSVVIPKPTDWRTDSVRVLDNAAEVYQSDIILTSVRIFTQGGSSHHRVWDLNALMLSFTSALVLLALPVKLVRVIAASGLGRLSRVYRRVIEQPFDLQQQCCRTVMQLMAGHASFSALADENSSGKEQNTISKARVRDCLQVLASGGEGKACPLMDRELESLTDMAFRQMLTLGQTRSRGLSDLTNTTGVAGIPCMKCGGRSSRDKAPATINNADFSRAACDPTMEICDLVRLFSATDRLSPLERLFMPAEILAARIDVSDAHPQGPEDPETVVGGQSKKLHDREEEDVDVRKLALRVQQLEAEVSSFKRTFEFNEGFTTGLSEVMKEVRRREASANAELNSALQRIEETEIRLLHTQHKVDEAVRQLEKRLQVGEFQEVHRALVAVPKLSEIPLRAPYQSVAGRTASRTESEASPYQSVAGRSASRAESEAHLASVAVPQLSESPRPPYQSMAARTASRMESEASLASASVKGAIPQVRTPQPFYTLSQLATESQAFFASQSLNATPPRRDTQAPAAVTTDTEGQYDGSTAIASSATQTPIIRAI